MRRPDLKSAPMLQPEHLLWPEGLPSAVGAVMSTRLGGVSLAPFDTLNLRPPGLGGDAVDDPSAVHENQRRYAACLEGALPVYLDQVHGVKVLTLEAAGLDISALPQADASVTFERGLACTVLTADCLPVLFATDDGQAVGAAHAGWRGLAAGVLEATVEALQRGSGLPPERIHAWLGACIGPTAFEVGADVVAAFGSAPPSLFVPTGQPGKWWANLPGLARWRLAQRGLRTISGGLWCTHQDAQRFFSFRRDRVTGRLAASIWRR